MTSVSSYWRILHTVYVWTQKNETINSNTGSTPQYFTMSVGTGDTTPPTLTAGAVNRTSDTAATIGFNTDEAGTAYYLVLNSGAPAPTSAAVKAGTSLGAVSVGANTGKAVTLTAGARDIYVVVEDAAGNASTPLLISAAAYATGTPPVNTVPTAPQNLTATPGNAQVTLSWAAPASNGGAAISKYEVSSDNGGTWVTASGNTSHIFTGLTNGQSYTFHVRAINSVGNGAAASVTATPSAGGNVNPGGGVGGGGSPAPTQTTPTTGGTVGVSYTQSGGAVTLALPDSKVSEIIGKADDTAILDLSGVKNTTSAALPKAALDKLAGAGLDVALKLPQGTITFSEAAAASLAQQATGANVSVQLNQTAASSLTSAQREAIKEGDLVFNISASSGNQNITSFNGTLTVSVPYSGPLPAGVWYLNSAGKAFIRAKAHCILAKAG